MPLGNQFLLIEAELKNLDPLVSRAVMWNRVRAEMIQAIGGLAKGLDGLDGRWRDGAADDFAGYVLQSQIRLDQWRGGIDKAQVQEKILDVTAGIGATYNLVKTNYDRARELEESLRRQAASLDPPGAIAYVLVENQINELQVAAGTAMDGLADLYRTAGEAVAVAGAGPNWSGLPDGAGADQGGPGGPRGADRDGPVPTGGPALPEGATPPGGVTPPEGVTAPEGATPPEGVTPSAEPGPPVGAPPPGGTPLPGGADPPAGAVPTGGDVPAGGPGAGPDADGPTPGRSAAPSLAGLGPSSGPGLPPGLPELPGGPTLPGTSGGPSLVPSHPSPAGLGGVPLLPGLSAGPGSVGRVGGAVGGGSAGSRIPGVSLGGVTGGTGPLPSAAVSATGSAPVLPPQAVAAPAPPVGAGIPPMMPPPMMGGAGRGGGGTPVPPPAAVRRGRDRGPEVAPGLPALLSGRTGRGRATGAAARTPREDPAPDLTGPVVDEDLWRVPPADPAPPPVSRLPRH
jgi:hypothetical protein